MRRLAKGRLDRVQSGIESDRDRKDSKLTVIIIRSSRPDPWQARAGPVLNTCVEVAVVIITVFED